jgi:hypothetical protein
MPNGSCGWRAAGAQARLLCAEVCSDDAP